jgi:hypothetical protein
MANTPVINVAGTDYNVIDYRCYFDGFSTNDNMFDKFATGVLRGEIHSRAGELVSAPGYCESDYIAVTPGVKYYQNYNRVYCTWYNSNKVYIGYSDYDTQNPQLPKTAPPNAAYGRFIWSLDSIDYCFVCAESDLVYQFPPVAMNFFELSTTKNMFDKNADGVIYNGYVSQWDVTEIISSDTFGDSAPIPVIVGHKYSTPVRNVFVLWLKADGTYAGKTTAEYFTENGYAEAPSEAATGRFVFEMSSVDSFYVYDITGVLIIPSKYLPDSKQQQNSSPWNGLIGVCFGTSITYRSQTTGGYLDFLPYLSGVTFDNQGIGSGTILLREEYPALDILAKVKSYSGYSGKRVCILEGFVNDWYHNYDKLGTWQDTTETTVCGCVRSALNYILSQNANITVFLVLDHYGRNYGGTDCRSTALNQGGKTQYEWYEEISKVAESLGVPVIRLYAISGISENTPQYLLDNIHPSSPLGARQTAYSIWEEMKRYYPNQIAE